MNESSLVQAVWPTTKRVSLHRGMYKYYTEMKEGERSYTDISQEQHINMATLQHHNYQELLTE